MELIAASRIVKAQQRVHAARPYSEQITEVVRDLAAGRRPASTARCSPAARPRSARVAYVVITADRGLCGGYNSNVIRAAERRDQGRRAGRGRDYRLVAVGKKAESYFRFRGYKIEATFSGFSDNPTYEDAREIAERRRRAVRRRATSTRSSSSTPGSSRPAPRRSCIRPLVPLDAELAQAATAARAARRPTADYEFEPDPTTILERLLPRYVEARMYAALLDAAASRARRPASGP